MVWVMGYDRCMGYGPCFPAYQVGNTKTLWGIAEYGFSGIWFIRESTVVLPIKTDWAARVKTAC